MQRLIDYNFKAIFINPNILFITWDIRITKSSAPKKIGNEKRNLDMKMKNLNSESNVYYRPNNNFKEITNYKPTTKLIYDDKSIVDFNNKANSLLFNKKKDKFFNF